MIRHNNIHTNITIIMFTTAFWWHVEKKGYSLYSFTLQWCQSRTLSLLTFWSARRHHADEKFLKTMATRLFRVILVRRGHGPFGQSQYIFGAEQNNRRLWDWECCQNCSLFVLCRIKTMGNKMDCCYNTRWSYQCIFPCIRFCTYTGRRVWYNYDGSEMVQPLVHLYHPQATRVNSLPEAFHGIDDDEDIMHQMEQSGGL